MHMFDREYNPDMEETTGTGMSETEAETEV